eukprot:m.19013 g.19013  ORF g.19013 m.19013 type:complete len:207 (+) comp8388_c0_seq1:105-725(+)
MSARFGLHNLTKIAGSTKEAIRVGRGRSSRRGKTAGRGHKGAGQHASKRSPLLFEGGQTPFQKRQPKHGFHNPNKQIFDPINLDTISEFVERGKLDATKPIDMKALRDSGAIGKQIKHGVKLLARGNDKFIEPLHIEVSKASKSAISAVERNGGSVTTVYHNQRTLQAHLKPEKYRPQKKAQPRGKDLAYYSSAENRGYLAQKDSK